MSIQSLVAIDEICERFEDRYQADPSTWAGKERAALVHHLLQIELEYRARCGDLPKADDLKARFADVPEAVATVLENPAFPTPLPVDALLPRLKDSGLFAPDALVKIAPLAGDCTFAQDLAQALVEQQLLTSFQAEEILAGRGKSLILGNYRLLDRIGAGGMGQVFKAHHGPLDRIVAVKLLPREVQQDATTIERFQRELKAAAKLSHPNIVVAHDGSETPDGIHFLVMGYVEGRDLSQVAAQEPNLPVTRVIDYMLQAARGLAYAHGKGIVHRDIKPSNLLLEQTGTIKILDMGLASIASAAAPPVRETPTKSHELMGTVDFMAPEQAADAHSIDGRADIYSLGCTMYRLLVGKNLFARDSVVQKLLAHQSSPIPSLRDARPDVSPELEAAFQKMVAKKPEDRFQTMAEVIAALEACGGTRANSAERSPVSPPKGRAVRVAIGFGILLLASAAVWAIVKDKLGKEVGRMKLPPDGSAVVRASGEQSAPASSVAKLSNPISVLQLRSVSNTIGMKLVLIPSGEFLMGSLPSDVDREIRAFAGRDPFYLGRVPDELPQHKLRITRPFYMSATTVTVGQFRRFADAANYKTDAEKDGQGGWGVEAGSETPIRKPKWNWRNVGYAQTDEHPVVNVTSNDAANFCTWLGRTEGAEYRLPTEAQWEYACRAGSTAYWCFGDDDAQLRQYAWYRMNGGGKSRPVGQKMPNAFGLYDMHGNVWQWCADFYEKQYYAKSPVDDPTGPAGGSHRVTRGGSGYSHAGNCRSAARSFHQLEKRCCDIGFRVVMLPKGK